MSWKPIIGKGMTLPQLQTFINGMKFDRWRPSGMVLHNTAAPSLHNWHQVPGANRMKNLEHYYKNERGWPSGPHAFVADDLVWPFTPFNTQGTHSPSWNGTRLGIEMVGDFSREDDDAGAGLQVKKNTVALFGMLHRKLGLDPKTIKLHKEDPRTTHDCPGKDIEKPEFIHMVQEWMGSAGDHDIQTLPITKDVPPSPPTYSGWVNTPGDTLNLRETSSASSKIIARLKDKDGVTVLSEGMNGKTKWLRVTAASKTGWVAARFVST